MIERDHEAGIERADDNGHNQTRPNKSDMRIAS